MEGDPTERREPPNRAVHPGRGEGPRLAELRGDAASAPMQRRRPGGVAERRDLDAQFEQIAAR